MQFRFGRAFKMQVWICMWKQKSVSDCKICKPGPRKVYANAQGGQDKDHRHRSSKHDSFRGPNLTKKAAAALNCPSQLPGPDGRRSFTKSSVPCDWNLELFRRTCLMTREISLLCIFFHKFLNFLCLFPRKKRFLLNSYWIYAKYIFT